MIKRPELVAICAAPEELVEDGGFHCKGWRIRFAALGYSPSFWYLRNTDFGGVVRQERLFVILQKQNSVQPTVKAPTPARSESTIRAATNMLKTHLIPSKAWDQHGWDPHPIDSSIARAATPCKLLGTARRDGRPVFCPTGSLPDGIGSWTRVTDIRGKQRIRRLLPEELAKAKGLPLKWYIEQRKMSNAIGAMTSVHLWTAVGDAIHASWQNDPTDDDPASTSFIPQSWNHDLSNDSEDSAPFDATIDDGDPEWTWTPPDLSEGGAWHEARIATLKEATKDLDDAERRYNEGLEALRKHRENYGPDGPKYLQLLWWEFPKEHQQELREGCPMNFLSAPTGDIAPNQEMEPEARAISIEFVDELKRIGTLRPLPPGVTLRANAPLFCVEKAAQLDQWRCIADMKRGGQNAHIGGDPVHLSGVDDILPHLCAGGWSAVADLSKFFYNFPTHPQDRPFLGCIHPGTGEILCYFGLPMGSGSSPGLAGRYGNSILRQLREREEIFQGTLTDNGWRFHIQGGRRKNRNGALLILLRRDGTPAALMWIHVDDILIHGPTKEVCELALHAFMDTTVRIGLVCQPCKSKPPGQVQLYCGFLYDSARIPCVRVPANKTDRAIASIHFLRSGTASERLSRLTLAVVIGLLQSLVGATPHNIGQTYLRRLYDRLHSLEGLPLRPSPSRFYFTCVELETEDWLDLDWWLDALTRGLCRRARSRHLDNLGVTWGDGSGTGTGGTFQVIPSGGDSMTMKAWMGVWQPQVFHFSSNWKELRTLLQSLEQERHAGRIQGCTVFYFTDNMVTYYISHSGGSSSPELHKLLRRLKGLEMELELHLEVVHVPGRHMIDQQTDGLSRGLSFSTSRLARSPVDELLRLFNGVRYTTHLVPWVMHLAGRSYDLRQTRFIDSLGPWSFSDIANQSTLWAPMPEWADQIISAVLHVWIEQPWNTESFFVVPRIFQRRWGRKSKHIVEVAVVEPDYVPGFTGSDIPVVILHLPCFVRSTPDPRLDTPPKPIGAQWHQKQADYVRGL